MVKDALGHVLCGATPESAQHFDDAVRALGLSYGDPIAALYKACLVSPRFKLAHLCKAWVLAIANDPALTDAARAILEGTVEFECNDRERAHELALRQAIAGNRMSASAILDRHTILYPLDLLAHLCALYMDAFGGRFCLASAFFR